MSAIARLMDRLSEWTGIDLHRGGRGASLERFIEQRTRALGLPSIDSFVDRLSGASDPEVERIVCAVTVGHTWFFRDAGQMEAIAQLLEHRYRTRGRVQIWVPGCSSGEDPYTIAMLAHRIQRRVFILATDINPLVLQQASAARFGRWSVRDLPSDLRPCLVALARGSPPAQGRSRTQGDGTRDEDADIYEIMPAVRNLVTFRRHNLLDDVPAPPDGGGWDLVVCRNVLIYFQATTALATLSRLGRSLSPGGWLLVGASEVVHSEPAGLCLRPLGGRFGLQRADTADPHPERVREADCEHVRQAEQMGKTPGPALPAVLPSSRSPSAAAENPVSTVLARGNAFLDAGEFAKAIESYAVACDLDPLCAEARMFAGIAHHMRGDPSSAVQELRSALVLDPDLWPGAFYLAINYEKLGLVRDAQREYQRVVTMSDRTPTIRSQLSVLGDIETWKRDVVALSRKRAQQGIEPAEAG